jgi:hypothetical protein
MPWATFEVVLVDEDGKMSTPFSQEIRNDRVKVAKRMKMLEDYGWPRATQEWKVNGKKRVVPKDDLIWLLKCTPDCWRLYFYVNENESRFIYVHAVCKKQDKEDASDLNAARRIADRLRSGNGKDWAAPFAFPGDGI